MRHRTSLHQSTEGAVGVRGLLCGDDASLRTLIVAAHPDDEVIGIGGLLPSLGDCHVVHVTNGAPQDPAFARHAGYRDPEAYAEARLEERDQVLSLAGVPPARRHLLPFVDLEVSARLVEVSRSLAALVRKVRPARIVTHAYEGGHPDHDGVAFAVYAARRLLTVAGEPPPAHVEMTSYHADGERMITGRFLEDPPTESIEVPLDARQQAQKRALFAGYASQRDVLAAFPVDVERFRDAPHYDFGAPPHEGPLYYELRGWFSGREWRRRAGAARVVLERGGA